MDKKMTLGELHDEMKFYNNDVAYGSECNAWQAFCDDCHKHLGCAPDDDNHWEDVVPGDFAEYWLNVANGKSADFDPATGSANR